MIQHDESDSENPDNSPGHHRGGPQSGAENYMSTISEQTTISNSCRNLMNNDQLFQVLVNQRNQTNENNELFSNYSSVKSEIVDDAARSNGPARSYETGDRRFQSYLMATSSSDENLIERASLIIDVDAQPEDISINGAAGLSEAPSMRIPLMTPKQSDNHFIQYTPPQKILVTNEDTSERRRPRPIFRMQR